MDLTIEGLDPETGAPRMASRASASPSPPPSSTSPLSDPPSDRMDEIMRTALMRSILDIEWMQKQGLISAAEAREKKNGAVDKMLFEQKDKKNDGDKWSSAPHRRRFLGSFMSSGGGGGGKS